MRKKILLVNFGGPRTLDEVHAFLKELLTDGDVIRTPFPKFLQDILFKRIAKKRSKKIAEDYAEIGGKSPIYEDTEWLSSALKKQGYETLTFHRYLPETHDKFLKDAKAFICEDTVVFPLFPQFSYVTTGSIARWMEKNLGKKKSGQLRWVKSYGGHRSFIQCFVNSIREFMKEKNVEEKETLLFFSPHGLPLSYVLEGDPYKRECEESYHQILKSFPLAGSIIGYQSQFGKAEWIRPYTNELTDSIQEWNKDYSQVIFVPLSFTSDHIETFFEVEKLYLPPIKNAGFNAFRCPAFNRRENWVKAIDQIIQEADLVSTKMLIR